MDFAVFLVQCLNAVQYGLLLFLVASGLTLIFGILGVINLAHGSFYMIGAYLAYALAPWAAAHVGGGFFTALLLGLAFSVALGYLLEWGFVSYLYEREHLQQVLMTYPVYRLFMSAVCIAVALGLYVVIARTRIGMAIRAGASNREMVQSLGVDIRLLYRIVFAAGVALAVFAGMIAAPVSSVYPGMGNQVLIVSFVVVVIGGIGSIRGAFLASLLVGFVDTFGKVFVPQIAGIVVYLLMALILLWRPEGLFRTS
jgi:branched-chain amino acid transport system permease protein